MIAEVKINQTQIEDAILAYFRAKGFEAGTVKLDAHPKEDARTGTLYGHFVTAVVTMEIGDAIAQDA